MVSQVKDVSQSMSEMKNATSELSIGADQILKALSSLVDTTEEVKDSSKEMSARVGFHLRGHAARLRVLGGHEGRHGGTRASP